MAPCTVMQGIQIAGTISATGSHLNSLCSCGIRRVDIRDSKTEGDGLQRSQRRRSGGRRACMDSSFELQNGSNRALALQGTMVNLPQECWLNLPSCSMACTSDQRCHGLHVGSSKHQVLTESARGSRSVQSCHCSYASCAQKQNLRQASHRICWEPGGLCEPLGSLGSGCSCCRELDTRHGMQITRNGFWQHAGRPGESSPAATDKAGGGGEATGTGVSPGTGVAAGVSAGDGDAGGPECTGIPHISCCFTALYRVTWGTILLQFARL